MKFTNSVKGFLRSHRKIVIAVFAPIFLFVIAVFIIAANETYKARKAQREFDRKTEKVQTALEKPYREDIYGGKTPEETWGLFLGALRKGDIDLASKYFVVEKQDKEKNKLKQIINENLLENTLKNFSTLEKEEGIKGDSAYYHIKMSFEKSQNKFIYSPVVFYFNPYTKVWKILVL